MRLAADDVEAFFTHEFHGRLEAELPSLWEPEIVAARLVCASKVFASITTRPGHKPVKSFWPDFQHSFEELVSYASERRSQVWESWLNAKPKYSSEVVGLAEEAMRWPTVYLGNRRDESRSLMIWATVKAANAPLEKIVKRAGLTPQTVRRHRGYALKRIADGLNEARVPVREAHL